MTIILRVAQTSKKFQIKKTITQQPDLKKQVSNASDQEKSENLLSVVASQAGQNGGLVLQNTSLVSGVSQNKSTSAKKPSSGEDKFSTRTRNLALMLIPVNILFLMFMAPVVITMYHYENLFDDKLTLAIVELLSYCNFSINFFIYFLTSSKFREEFFKFINECSTRFGIKNVNLNQNKGNKHNSTLNYLNKINQNVKSDKPSVVSNKNNKLIIPLLIVDHCLDYTSKSKSTEINDIKALNNENTNLINENNLIHEDIRHFEDYEDEN